MNKLLIAQMATTRVAPMFAAAVESERNRKAYIEQSANTVAGQRAEFGERYARAQSAVSDEEMREAFALKYGS